MHRNNYKHGKESKLFFLALLHSKFDDPLHQVEGYRLMDGEFYGPFGSIILG